jgi:hypothetical protein
MAEIFISYSRKDRDAAQRVASALESVGHSVWWDREIRGGEDFDEVIERELDLAGVVVVLWSKQSATSNWVRSEAAAALERGVLVPVFIEKIKLPLEFRRKHTIDLTTWRGDLHAEEFQLICDAIAVHLPTLITHSPTNSPSTSRSLVVSDKQKKSPFLIAPISVLRAGIKAVPAVKYALGIAGIGAALAISSTFFTTTAAALTGIGLMLPLMVLLVIFASIAGLARKELRRPALVFTWSILIIFLGSVGLFVSSVFFKWPRSTGEILNIESQTAKSNSQKRFAGNLLTNGGFEQVTTDGFLYKWDLRTWRSIGDGEIDQKISYRGSNSARVGSSSPGHVRWAQILKVARDTPYVLTAMIKSLNVIHAENPNYILGANIGVLGVTDRGEEIIKYSDPVLGTKDWQKKTVRFETGANDRILVVLELGGYSATASGTVWFDDAQLEAEEISPQKAP